jgi:hypothetical protein
MLMSLCWLTSLTNCIRLDRQVASLFPQFSYTWVEVRCLKIIVASIYTEAARFHPFQPIIFTR